MLQDQTLLEIVEMSLEASQKSNWKIVNGAKLHYITAGNGSHTLLLIPGALGIASNQFKPQLEYFGREGSGFKVIAIDLRGYGKSYKEDRPSLNAFLSDAEDCHTLMQSLSLTQFSVVGFCYGGKVGLTIASLYPESVKSVITSATSVWLTEERLKFISKFKKVSSWEPLFLEPLIEVSGLAGLPAFEQKFIDYIDCLHKCYEETGTDPCAEVLPFVTCPTLVMQGAKDTFTPLSHGEFLHSKLPGSQFFIVPEGKHFLHLKHCELANRVIHEFISSNYT